MRQKRGRNEADIKKDVIAWDAHLHTHTAFFSSSSCCVAALRSEQALRAPTAHPLLEGAGLFEVVGLLEAAPCVLMAGDVAGGVVLSENMGRHGRSKVLVDSINGWSERSTVPFNRPSMNARSMSSGAAGRSRHCCNAL